MTNEEAKNALMNRSAVLCGGLKYDCISAIIYRKDGNRIAVKVELKDEKADSVTIANLKDVSEVITV